MYGKTRLIMALLMSSVMVLMVTLVVTYVNLGLRADFVRLWARAYLIAWPAAATTAFLVLPTARRITEWLITMIDSVT